MPSIRGEARHARLDRLARSVSLIASLVESGVDFVAVDMPLANRFTIHILAAVAEYEARLISERSKAAMAAAKARGRQFGNPDPRTHRFSDAARKAGIRAIREKAKARALDYLPLLCELRDRGETIQGIALQLTAMGIKTPRGRMIWRDKIVAKLFEYAGERKPSPWASRHISKLRLSKHEDLPTFLARPARDGHAPRSLGIEPSPRIFTDREIRRTQRLRLEGVVSLIVRESRVSDHIRSALRLENVPDAPVGCVG